MTARQLSAEKAYYFYQSMKQAMDNEGGSEANCLDEAKYTYLTLADDDFDRASEKFARKQIVGVDNKPEESEKNSIGQSIKAWVCEWRVEWPQSAQLSLG